MAKTMLFPSMVMAGGQPQLADIKAVSASYRCAASWRAARAAVSWGVMRSKGRRRQRLARRTAGGGAGIRAGGSGDDRSRSFPGRRPS
jgi:hypothetical protein